MQVGNTGYSAVHSSCNIQTYCSLQHSKSGHSRKGWRELVQSDLDHTNSRYC